MPDNPLPPTFNTYGLCLSYNGVLLQDCELVEWDHRMEYDPQSQCYLWDRIRITVTSMMVSNANFMNESVALSGNTSANRIHHSQAFTANQAAYGWLMPDQWVGLHGSLSAPQEDFILWINHASHDATSAVLPFRTDPASGSTSHRRILLAACGHAGKNDYHPGDQNASPPVSDNQFTDLADYIEIFDPWVNAQAVSNSYVLRRNALDCSFGPRPIAVEIMPLVGTKASKIKFTIEICRTPVKFDGGGDSNDRKIFDQFGAVGAKSVIHNRWSLTDSLDESGRVTHSIRGKLIVSDTRYKPNAMRLMAFPLAFPFAKLLSRNYIVSEDGKTLAYDFNYTHAGAAPPWGVRDYSANYAERWSPELKGTIQGHMTIKVKGWYHRSINTGQAPNIDTPNIEVTERTQKYILLNQAIVIMLSRIRGLVHKINLVPGNKQADEIREVKLLDMQVIEQVGIPELELRVVVMQGKEDGKLTDIFLRLQNLGAPFYEGLNQGNAQQIRPYDPKWWPIDNEWGRLLAWDDGQPDYLYGPLDNDANFRSYADYGSIPDHQGTGNKLPPKTKLPSAERRSLRQKNNQFYSDDGHIDGAPFNGSIATADNLPASTTNPINQPVFSAVVSALFNGAVIPASKPPESVSHSGVFDPNQLQGSFSYIAYETEVLSDSATGVVGMPLSKPRNLSIQPESQSNSYAKPKETATAVRLFAGSGKRIVSIKADRLNAWPIIPYPAEILTKREIISGSSSEAGDIVSVEYLVQKEIIDDAPQPSKTGQAIVYSTNMRLTYSSSRPWMPNNTQAGFIQSQELFPIAANMMLRHDEATQKLMLPSNQRFSGNTLT